MYISTKQFKAVEKALLLLPSGVMFSDLDAKTQETILQADIALMEVLKKNKASNAKTWNYIKEKRKHNKNYARKKEG